MSTPSDQPLPSAPKSPLSGASIPPAPAPAAGAASSASVGAGLTKPTFKVTRSPFSPKITGAGGAGAGAADVSATNTAARPPARKKVAATGDFTAEEKPALVVLDFLAAGVAIAAAVMMALAYFKK